MVHGLPFGSPHFVAPVATKSCGTFLEFMYFWIAVLDGVPSGWNTSSDTGLSGSVTPNALRVTLGLPSTAGSGPTGRGIGVAIVDSGISPSFDFGTRIDGFFDFTKGGIPAQPYDDYGHGTHIAGLVASTGVVSLQGTYRGVAAGARLIDLKVLDGTGAGYTSDVVRAIEFAVANKDTLRIDVINLSLGQIGRAHV